MSSLRTRWSLLALGSMLAFVVSLTLGLGRQQVSAQAAPLRSFGVKFVCGYQSPTWRNGEPLVKPGNYATEINILNYTNQPVSIRKYVIPLAGRDGIVYREPRYIGT